MKKQYSVRAVCRIAMFAAVISVLSLLTVPTPWGVPFTLQTFAVALAGYVLGRKNAAASVCVYLALGLAGMPVFSGMKAGFGVLFGPTGGYLIGFLFLAFFCGCAGETAGAGRLRGSARAAGYSLAGLACCHGLGIVQLKYYYGLTWSAAVMSGTAPYLFKDILSLIAAFFISAAIRKSLAAANLMRL